MKIDKSLHNDHAVLTLKGEFDTLYCPHLQEEVEDLVERGVRYLILNLRLVKFINSTALGAIIKAHKRCKAEGGDMVISQPSTFVKDIIGKVGLDRLLSIYEQEDEATKHVIRALNAEELAGNAPVDREKIMIKFPDETRNKQIGGKKTLLGTMANVDGQQVQFTWNGAKGGINGDQAKQLFFEGSDLHLKFQVKLIKKGYFEPSATVTSAVKVDGDTVRVTASFAKIADNDRSALEQFAEDMEFLKKQLPGQ